jgi:hypothetical protein
MSDIRPFRIEVPASQLEDLKQRLAATRFPIARRRAIGARCAACVCRNSTRWANRYDGATGAAQSFPQYKT